MTGSESGSLTSISSVMFYLVAYGAATIGAFALVTMVRDPSGEASRLNSWVGLGRRAPLAATIFSIFMLSFAGIPLTSGFVEESGRCSPRPGVAASSGLLSSRW